MRRLLRFLFPYIDLLEQELERTRTELRLYQDRLLLLTTGAPLKIEHPPEELEETKQNLKKLNEKIKDEMEEQYPTFTQLLAAEEAKTFREDAGIEAETSPAQIVRSEEELTEEEQKALDVNKRKFRHDFQRASEEYLKNTRPTLEPSEQRKN